MNRPEGARDLMPRLYLSSFSTMTRPGNFGLGGGLFVAAMALPPSWARGVGWLDATLSPDPDLLRGVQESHGFAPYFRAYQARLEAIPPERFRPGVLSGFLWEGWRAFNVGEESTLFCTCARPTSPRRRHGCHLEILAPFLVRAGWRVILYGRALEAGFPDPAPIWVDTQRPYSIEHLLTDSTSSLFPGR